MSLPTIDYDEVASAYRESLITRLRGFQVGPEFLDAWVDHEDPVEAVLGLFEAASEHGLPGLCVRVSEARGLDVRSLQAAAMDLGHVGVSYEPDEVSVTIRFVEGGRVTTEARTDARAHEELVRVGEEEARREGEGPEAWALGEAHRTRAHARAGGATHEGPWSDGEGGSSRAILSSEAAGVTLRALVDTAEHLVVAVRFEGARTPEQRGVLEALAVECEGVPLREALDHAVARAELALRERSGPRPVAGIVLPENAAPAFETAQRLVRGWAEDYRARGFDPGLGNRFDRGVSEAWSAKGAEGQRDAVARSLEGALPALGFGAESVRCARVAQHERVVLVFEDDVAREARPWLLMALERGLKEGLDPGLFVTTEERRDANKLRRL